jgi:hypothetical protein
LSSRVSGTSVVKGEYRPLANVIEIKSKQNQKEGQGTLKNHDVGTAIIDLRFVVADNDAVARGDGRSLFSFSSDAEPDELCCDVDRSTSDDAVVASFAWRSSSMPDIDDGRRLVTVGDLTPGRPSVEDVEVTRVCVCLRQPPVADVVVENDARCRAGRGPIEPSIVRTGFTVVGVGTLLVDAAPGGVITVADSLCLELSHALWSKSARKSSQP